MVAEATHLRVTEQLVPTARRDSSATNLLEATRGTRSGGGDLHSADPESADPDEPAVGECDQRYKRADRASDRASVAGERDPRKLAEFRDPRIQASEEEIAKSLEGNWRAELLFVLQQELEMYDTYQRRIAECDSQLQKHLASLTDSVPPRPPEVEPEPKKGKRAKPAKNAPRFDLSRELRRITGVDLTRIDGIDVMIAQTLLSEVGVDMSRWKTEAHFASWLGLCPDNRVSGDKVLRRGTRHVVNRAANALRQAANALIRSRSYLGAQYRRLRTKLGAPKAITAMAHRLARLVYRMLKYGQRYIDKGTEYYEQRYRNQQVQLLRKNATKLGFQITEAQA